jgi:hypothetical protein
MVDVTYHFWMVTYPFFDSVLLIATGPEDVPIEFKIYDVDGALTAETTLKFSAQTTTPLKFDELMSGCKMESGIKHAHVAARPKNAAFLSLQIESVEWSTPISPMRTVLAGAPIFAPFVVEKERAWIGGLVNINPVETLVRVRSIVSKTISEAQITVPGFGVRTISAALFANHQEWEEGFGYLKLSVRGADEQIGVQVIEGILDKKARRHYSGVG